MPNKKTARMAVAILALLLCFLSLTACQTTDKSESYFYDGNLSYASFDYESSTGSTRVVFSASLSNETIYDINGFSVTFDLYLGSTYLGSETYEYEKGLKHGEEDYRNTYSFNVAKKVDKIEFVSWTAHYKTFGETYREWLIGVAVVAALLAIIYLIVMVVEDLYLDDVFDFVGEHWYLLFYCLPFSSSVIFLSWVVPVIVFGGVVAVVAFIFLAHLVKFVLEEVDFFDIFSGIVDFFGDMIDFFKKEDKVSNHLDDPKALENFTVEELKEYCREVGIRGFSSLNKVKLIERIVSFQTGASKAIPQNSNGQADSAETVSNSSTDEVPLSEERNKFLKTCDLHSFEYNTVQEPETDSWLVDNSEPKKPYPRK